MTKMFERSTAKLGVLVSMVVLLCLPSVAFAGPVLGTAQSFAVLGSSTSTNTGSTTISGNVGTYAGSAITGFPPGLVFNGSIHTADAVALQAQNDETYAYNSLAALSGGINESGTDLGGLTLTPGIYKFTTAASLTGTIPLTLDFQGNPNAQFVFQIGSTLTTGSASTVLVKNGSSGNGIFWQVGSSATLGTTTTFAGNILALASVTLTTGAKIECGRAFAQTGAVTMDSNVISSDCTVNNFASGRTDFGSSGFSPTTSSIPVFTPEPGTFLLFGMSLLGVVAKYSARKK